MNAKIDSLKIIDFILQIEKKLIRIKYYFRIDRI